MPLGYEIEKAQVDSIFRYFVNFCTKILNYRPLTEPLVIPT